MSHNTQILHTGYGSLEVLTGGNGPALVFLHGEEGQRSWLAHHEQLANSFSVWAPTLPGMGKSQRPDWVESVPDMAKIMLNALDKAGIGSCILGGASIGGWVAAEMASMDPDHFNGLVLAGSQGLPTGHLNTPDIFLTPYRRYISLGYADSTSDAFQTMWPEELSDEAVEQDLEIMELAARLGFKPYMYDRSLLPSLARFEKPVLLVWGDKDIITPQVIANQFKNGLAQATIKTIAAAGHYVHLEQPRNFVEAVAEFGEFLVNKEVA